MSDDPESLRHLGQLKKPPYQLKSTAGEIPARLEFTGAFEGIDTTWDATVWPLGDYPDPLPCEGDAQQFMDIGNTDHGVTPITIGLNIPELDDRALLMALIMVRKYKRLRRGLICFGRNAQDI